jgi:hypothetical protein
MRKRRDEYRVLVEKPERGGRDHLKDLGVGGMII